jgi:hypothetical protein
MPKHISEIRVLTLDTKIKEDSVQKPTIFISGELLEFDVDGNAVASGVKKTVAATQAKNNFSNFAGPTVNDDSGDGYSVGSKWFYQGTEYTCTDATVDAAVWEQLGGGDTSDLENELYPIAYTSSGTDQNLLSPSDQYATISNFNPISDGFNGEAIVIGTFAWYYNGGTWAGLNSGSNYGTIYFTTSLISWMPWDIVASSTNNGLKTFTLPRLEHGDSLGGSFKFYFDSDAWSRAFLGNLSPVVIAQNGDVFKGSIAPQNLVVDHNGRRGPAGTMTEFVSTSYIPTGGKHGDKWIVVS